LPFIKSIKKLDQFIEVIDIVLVLNVFSLLSVKTEAFKLAPIAAVML